MKQNTRKIHFDVHRYAVVIYEPRINKIELAKGFRESLLRGHFFRIIYRSIPLVLKTLLNNLEYWFTKTNVYLVN